MPTSGEREPLLQRHGLRAATTLPDSSLVKATKISRRKLAWTLTGLWSAIFLSALDGTIAATLMTPIGSHFRQSQKSSYLGTSYLLSSCCFTPLYGRLCDILGRKGAMQLALTLFTIGTLFCGLALSMDTLIMARAIAGMGGGGILTVASVTMTDFIPLKQRGLYQGFVNLIFGLGSAIGGPLGGWINDAIGWRWAFLMQIPFLLISMAIVTLTINIQHPSNVKVQSTYERLRQIDWLGSLTLVFTVGCLLLGLSLKTAEDMPWSNPLVWGLLTGSGISAMLFVAVEGLWSEEPVMPLRLLAQRTPMAVAIANLLSSVTNFTLLYNVPLYFSAVRLTTSSQAGLHLLPNAVAASVSSLFAGWIMGFGGKLYYLTIASALLTAISSILIATWNERTIEFRLWFDIVPNGVGGSSLITTLLIALISSVPREDMAVATGISYLFRTIGQVLGVTLSGALVQAVLIRQLRQRITGPGSEELIERIRHETGIIATLDPPRQQGAVDSYASALKAAFVFQACAAVCIVLTCLSITEVPLPSSHEEQDVQAGRKQDNQGPRLTDPNNTVNND